MCLGDVLNTGQDMLVCISGEGSLQVFDITPEPDAWTPSEASIVLEGPTVRHPVPVNICRAIVADIGLWGVRAQGDMKRFEGQPLNSSTQRATGGAGHRRGWQEGAGRGPHRPRDAGVSLQGHHRSRRGWPRYGHVARRRDESATLMVPALPLHVGPCTDGSGPAVERVVFMDVASWQLPGQVGPFARCSIARRPSC